MKIAIFSGIHGNTIALDAVLDDIRARGGADEFMILGDLAAIGHDPVGVLKRIAALENTHLVRGNTDSYLVNGVRPSPTLEEVRSDMSLLPKYVQVINSFAWTQGAVSANGWLRWLRALPLDYRTVLPDGTRLLAVHASPGCDDGRGILPNMTKSELETLLRDCDADVVLVGHHHIVMDMQVGKVRVINPGSVSNPFPPDLRASYAVLSAEEAGHRIEFRRVDYDRDRVIDKVQQVEHPAAEYITSFMRGQRCSPWLP